MHEYSIVQALLDQCETHVDANHASRVIKVVIKIGLFSGVEPDLLKTAFDTFKEETVCAQAELIMDIQPLLLYCQDCSQESLRHEAHYQCLHCHSTQVEVLDGEDMFLMQLEME